MGKAHHYSVAVRWTGNTGAGTAGYRSYERSHEVTVAGKPPIEGSADRTFFGGPQLWNPEEMLVAALSQCHLLSYLALCAREGVVVTGYTDAATGTMTTDAQGWSGSFTEVVLHPVVTVAEEAMVARAVELHHDAHRSCFIAGSVNFPVRHEPSVSAASTE